MLKNYVKVAFRSISRQKFYALLNILGLTIGIAATLFITLYVSDELSYDKFHKDGHRIYRANLKGKISGQEIQAAVSCPPMANALLNEVPEVDEALRIAAAGNVTVKYEDRAFTEERAFFADSNFFHFFSFELLQGDKKTALKDARTVVITEEMARKYFGDESPLGKLISIGNDTTTYAITGIAANPPSNSHFTFDFILAGEGIQQFRDPIWLNNYIYTYMKLHENTSADVVKTKINDLTLKYLGPEVERFMGLSMEQFKEQGSSFGYTLIPLLDIHLRSPYQGESQPQGDIQYVILFSAIAFFTLVIACINFMNLATARSAGRAKEVGLRKTLGSLRGHLITQFLAESFIFSGIAAFLSVGIVYLLLPSFNFLAGKELQFNAILSVNILVVLIGVVILVALLAGSYPAFYLTSFKITEVLKGKVREGMKGGGIRSGLVVFQFAVSIFLIVCTVVIFQQMNFVQQKNLGFNRENVLIVSNAHHLGNNRQAFKNELERQSAVVNTSYSSTVPAASSEGSSIFRTEGSDQDHLLVRYYADFDHVKTMGYEIKEGRYFSRDFPSDSTAIVVNEAVLREMGWKEGVGKDLWGYSGGDSRTRFTIIGVVKDFNFETLRNDVRPVVMFLNQTGNFISLRLQGDVRETVAQAEATWKQYAGNQPFEYSFLDENFDELFRSEQRMGQLFTSFTTLAIVIACLGLIGLAAFTAEKRTKELGIRKVLGASEFSLINLLSFEFVKLVLIAFALAAFPAWYFSSKWLEGFAYRIDFNFWILLISGLVAVIVALLCVSFQALRAARLNPAKSLRYE